MSASETQKFTDYALSKLKKFEKDPLVYLITTHDDAPSFHFSLKGNNHLDIIKKDDLWEVQLNWRKGHRVTVGEILDNRTHNMNDKFKGYPSDITLFVTNVINTFKKTLTSNTENYVDMFEKKTSLKGLVKKKIANYKIKQTE